MTTLMTPPPAVGAAALAAFEAAADAIIADTLAAALARPDEIAQHGADAAELVEIGLRWTTKGLVVAMQFGTTDLLEDQLAWASNRLPHDGVAPAHVLHRFEWFRDAVDRRLEPAHAGEVRPWVDWLVQRQAELAAPPTG